MFDFYLWVECGIVFFTLITMLSYSYGFKYTGLNKIISLLVGLLVFALIFWLVMAKNLNYAYNTIIILILGTVYSFLFVNGNMVSKVTFVTTYIYCITSLKGMLCAIYNTDSFYTNGYFTNFIMICSFIFGVGFCILFFYKHTIRLTYLLPKKYLALMGITPTVISITTQNHMEKSLDFYVFALGFSSVIICYYLSYVLIETYSNLYKSKEANSKLALQLDTMERYTGAIEQMRRDKHEMKNVYFYIQSLVKTDNIDELEEFVENKLLKKFDALEEFNTGNKLLDMLLIHKVNEARDSNISVMCNVLIAPNLKINDYDLCGLLMNVLDNAIDASKLEKEKDIQIDIKMVKKYLSIVIKNKISTRILENNPNLKTTKQDMKNHGLGIEIINNIVKKYEGILDFNDELGYFVVMIMLKI